jgi:hypothetical protein
MPIREGNIKVDLKENGVRVRNEFLWRVLVNTAMNLQVP